VEVHLDDAGGYQHVVFEVPASCPPTKYLKNVKGLIW
jgi:hypothetical protein